MKKLMMILSLLVMAALVGCSPRMQVQAPYERPSVSFGVEHLSVENITLENQGMTSVFNKRTIVSFTSYGLEGNIKHATLVGSSTINAFGVQQEGDRFTIEFDGHLQNSGEWKIKLSEDIITGLAGFFATNRTYIQTIRL